MDSKYLHLDLDLKNVAPTGTFTGWASVYGVVDHDGDAVMPGAFTNTLAARDHEIVILNQHDPADPIGKAKLFDRAKGLWVEGTLELDIQSAREAHVRLKKGLIGSRSIGFRTVREKFRNGVRELHEIDLWEISLVTFAACEPARVESVKAQGDPSMLAWAEFRDGLGVKRPEEPLEGVLRVIREARGLLTKFPSRRRRTF